MSPFRHPPPDPATLDRDDPLSRMTAVTLAREVIAVSWEDAEKLRTNQITEKIAGQLYASLGSILANLGEGYSRSSGKDRAKIFEYALGSVRESMMWYRTSTRVLGQEVVDERLVKLEQIRRLLLAIIPRERGKLVRPKTK
ncbi:MAG TPA: four helix bundle protein [Gemmatimonadaceae bacterium]|nr:four helix bundle protein [Gemmatimonadaceae bacterium]